jgi:pimeloyl-ACP methyl ester carboxylesterase/DNA-binding CsgD family transcriptional regulator
MDEQSIRFITVAGDRVPWAVVGAGPPLVLGGWWMSQLELNWRDPTFHSFIAALARHRTVIRYDSPGLGIAAGGGRRLDLDQEVAVLAAVVDAGCEERIDLFGTSAGGPVAAAYAAAEPGRVRRAILYGTYASGAEIADEGARESILALVRRHWGLGSRVLADIFMTAATPAQREDFVEFQRKATSAEDAARSLEAVYDFDVAARLGAIEAPVRVLHRRDDRAIPFRLGRDLAARIPDATFVPLGGADHFPWLGDQAAVARAILAGAGVPEEEIDLPSPAEPTPEPAAPTDLSERELEILRLVALGLGDREIAERLVLSPHTVHRHVANIRTKLRLPSRAAAAAHAARLGLL